MLEGTFLLICKVYCKNELEAEETDNRKNQKLYKSALSNIHLQK